MTMIPAMISKNTRTLINSERSARAARASTNVTTGKLRSDFENLMAFESLLESSMKNAKGK